MTEHDKELWAYRYGWWVWCWLSIAAFCLTPVGAMLGGAIGSLLGFAASFFGMKFCNNRMRKFETAGETKARESRSGIGHPGGGCDGFDGC
jgi:hypothetical protein